ncbi:MAG: hypothetical protein ACRDRS_14875 [Pseudonocardiaceae bacterium]
MDYPTQDGLANYSFSIEFQKNEPTVGWRIYIAFRPLDQGKGDNSQWPYQATDQDGRSYVDWPAKLDTPGDAKNVAARWAEISEKYQRGLEIMRIANDAAKKPRAKKPRAMKRRRPKAAA